jgi:hypothetical protein
MDLTLEFKRSDTMFDFILKNEDEKYSEMHSLCLMFSDGHDRGNFSDDRKSR